MLISNFNDEENLQGTGTTIVELSPEREPDAVLAAEGLRSAGMSGRCRPHDRAHDPARQLRGGRQPAVQRRFGGDVAAGCLIVLDPHGHPVETIAGKPINGPWDMTAASFFSFTDLFVSNVLNGTVEHGEKTTLRWHGRAPDAQHGHGGTAASWWPRT